MNKNWFECTIVYNKVMEDGVEKKTSESYVLEAVSHGDAENRCIEQCSPYISGEFEVSKVQKKRFAEIIRGEGDYYFLAKVQMITLDEKTGQEKRQSVSVLIQAKNIQNALDNLNKEYSNSILGYEVVAMDITGVLDVFEIAE